MIPGPSPRSRQSWVCSPSGSENQLLTSNGSSRSSREDILKDPSNNRLSAGSLQLATRRPLQEARNQDTTRLYEQQRTEPERAQKRQLPAKDPNAQQQMWSSSGTANSRFDLYDRTRPESIYSRPSNEQIYDKIKDPIYECVKPEANYKDQQQQQQMRFPVTRAEPQVPIYRPGRRAVARRASEGSGCVGSDAPATPSPYGSCSSDTFRSNDADSRLSIDSKSGRDSSPISKDSSMSSLHSNSTLTGGNDCCSEDSIIMNRIRKSFEQKEEFLRRPSHPTGWVTTSSPIINSTDDPGRSVQSQSVIQREFYARPQKLQRQVWPPNGVEHFTPKNSSKCVNKPQSQNLQRVKSDADVESDREHSTSPKGEGDYGTINDNYRKADQSRPTSQKNAVAANRAAFITTLSRIHESTNGTIQQSQESRSGTSSLPSSPGPEKRSMTEKFPIPPQGLQIVSRRAKQFESGRLLSDDDEPTSDRTNLYKSELSRLSSKRSVPNVAVRKREFESKAGSQEGPRRITVQRESKSLDSGEFLSNYFVRI